MPLFTSFSAISARSLGMTSGIGPGKPTMGSPSGVTATTITINFTIVLGSFALSKFEYSLNGGAYTGSISGVATSFQFTGLVPSTSYTFRIRAVDVSGQISEPSDLVTQSTSTEVAPSAPTVTVTQKESTGTPINATKLDVSFGAAAAGTYPVVYYQYSVYRGATLVTDWTTTPVGTGTTFTLTGLLHNASHTVYVRGVATANGITFGTQGSGTASTDAEIINSAPTVTIDSETTTNVTFTRGSSSGGTYGVSKYRYQIKNGSGTIVTGPTDLTNASTQFTVVAGVGVNATFSVEVFAISSTSGTSGSVGSASGQLDPSTPDAPTLSFASTGASERGSAFLSWNAPTYATQYKVFKNGVEYSTTTSTSMTVAVSAGADFNFTVKAGNRLDAFSGNSNTKSMTTGATGVSWSMTSGTTSPVRYFGTTVSCDAYIGSLYIDIGSVPTNSGDAGYKYIQTIGYEVAQIPGSTLTYTSLANRRLYFLISGVAQSPPTGWEASGVATIIRREVPQHGLDTNFALDFYTNGVLLGGSNISNTRISVTPDGVNWADYVTCQENVVDNLNTSIRGRNLYITGYQTTATTYA
jgi:hypothetical protein